MTPYSPIDCNFYDRIEAAIVQRRRVVLEYLTSDGKVISKETLLKDTLTQSDGEFIVLPDGEKIRMDQIVQLDGEPLPGSC